MSDEKGKKKITVHADPEAAVQPVKPTRPPRRPKVTIQDEGTGEPAVKVTAQKGAKVDVNVAETGEKPIKVNVRRPAPRSREPYTVTIPRINGMWLVVIALVVFIVYMLATRPAPAPVGTDGTNGQNTTTNQQETAVNCLPVNGIVEGAVIRVMAQQYLKSSPNVSAGSVSGIVVLTTDNLTVLSSRTGCDDGRLWANVRMSTSSSNATGWVILQEDGTWLFGFADVPAPATTEQASSSNTGNNGRQSMRSIRVGTGTCVPRLQPADFQDATNHANPAFRGYWIYSNSNPGNMFVRSEPVVVGANLNAAGHNIVGVLPVGQGVEVIAHSDGFHYACGSNMVYWHVRYHDTVLGPIEGWIAEGGNGTMFMMGAD